MNDFKTYSKSIDALDLALSSSISHFFLPIHVFRTLRPVLSIHAIRPTPQDYKHDIRVQIPHLFRRLDLEATKGLSTIDKIISRCVAPSALSDLFVTAALRGKWPQLQMAKY